MKVNFFLFIILMFALPQVSFSLDRVSGSCHQLEPSFIQYPDDSFMAFRSNNPHYWNFVKKLKEDSQFANLFYLNGVGIGDFHVLNMADIELVGGGRKVGLVDMDDVGLRVPLLFDLARELVASQLMPVKLNLDSLMRSFFYGVQNISIESQLVKSVLQIPHEKFEENYSEMILSMTENERFAKDSEVTALDKAPVELVVLFEKMQSAFQSALKDYDKNYRVLDYGFRVKSSGGSKGIPRFLYLIENSQGQKEIIEFKQFVKSAADNFEFQGINKERFEAAKRVYRPAKPSIGLFGLVEKDNYSFISRSVVPGFIGFPISQKMKQEDKRKLQDFIQYTVNQYGLTLGEQLTSYQRDWLLNNKDLIASQLTEFVKRYRRELNSKNKKHPILNIPFLKRFFAI